MSPLKLIFGALSTVAVFGVLLFLPAGTLNWWRAGVFLGVALVGSIASTVPGATCTLNPSETSALAYAPMPKKAT